MEDSTSTQLRTAQIICGALMFGTVAFWAIAFVLRGGDFGFSSDLSIDPLALLAGVIVLALGAFAAALFFRSRALSVGETPSRRDAAPVRPPVARVQSNLIVSWAALEGQAMIAAVFFLLTGMTSLLVVSALVFGIGFAMTFPRAEWFVSAHRGSAA